MNSSNKKMFTAGNLEINSAYDSMGNKRTMASVTGISPDTQLELVGFEPMDNKMKNIDSIYRIYGTRDAAIVHYNVGEKGSPCWTSAEISKDYFVGAHMIFPASPRENI